MGRPFQEELAAVPENIAFALDHSVDPLREAFDELDSNIITCGAGGSYSAAVFCQQLLTERGLEAQSVTPLQLIQAPVARYRRTLVLFTAGGRNKDVIRAIEYAAIRRWKLILVCATLKSPAAKKTASVRGNLVFDFSYPAKRDGFLAVNSLAVTWWLLARAAGFGAPAPTLAREILEARVEVDYIPRDRRHVFLVLHDWWSRAVAIDLESKMSEAGVGAPLITDWRQFGHGRHHWIAKNAGFTSIISLETPASSTLARRTLRLLPPAVPQQTLTTQLAGSLGACELLLRAFALVGALGRRVRIDPGRPGVPAFGSLLYHLAPPRLPRAAKRNEWDVAVAIERKLSAIASPNAAVSQRVSKAATAYQQEITRAKFHGVALDFDGTVATSGLKPNEKLPPEVTAALIRLLKARVVVGIATGRGDSCHSNLCSALPERYWSRVWVCHLNGASVGVLSDLVRKLPTWPALPELAAISEDLAADAILHEIAEIAPKGPQLTLRPKSPQDAQAVEALARFIIMQRHSGAARVVASSHTVDIVPRASSKLALASAIKKVYGTGANILAIGDRGDLGGNDFELLSQPYSLSVDRVSPDLRSCWNFLPEGVSHHAGTVFYLERIRLSAGALQLLPA
jgi:hydroxymethylpyrimidine pyrophosphatase-like HAD family hydrolase